MRLIGFAALVAACLATATQASTINLSRNATQSSAAVLFEERSAVAVGANRVTVDYLVGSNLSIGQDFKGINTQNAGLDLTAGTYDVSLMHFDPLVKGSTSGTFSFAGDIVALILSNKGSKRLLNDSDAVLGLTSTYTYESNTARRAEKGDRFRLIDANTLYFNFGANGSHIDNVRVITTAVSAIPLPAGLPLLLAGLGGLAVIRKRRGQQVI